jgi:class 3 adenylate cyclase
VNEPQNDTWLASPPELNARLLRPMLRFFESRWGRPALEAFAARQGTHLEVLEDQDRWFGTERFMAFNRQMIEETGDRDIIYKAGRAFVEPGIIGVDGYVIRALLTPRAVYEQAVVITSRYSRVTNWQFDIQGESRATVTFRPISREKDDREFCRNRIGTLEAVPMVFGLPQARVEHPTCLHEGGDACVYDVQWTNLSRWVRPLFAATVVCLSAGGLLLALGNPIGTQLVLGGGALGAIVTLGAFSATRRVVAQAARIGDGRVEHLQSLLEDNKRRVEQLLLLQAVNEAVGRHLDEGPLIDAVLDTMARASTWDRALVMMVDNEAGVLTRTRARGFAPAAEARLAALEISLTPKDDDARLFGNIVRNGQPVLIVDVAEYTSRLTPANAELLRDLESTSLVAVPVESQGEKLALIVVDRVGGAAALDARDRDQIRSVAAALGKALSNAMLYGRVRRELAKNQKFTHYLPPPVVALIQRDPEAALQLGGQRTSLAVMFCDIADFTHLTANRPPEEIVRGLNAWFAIADPAIEASGGIVDKRMGDGILVVFLDAPERTGTAVHPVQRAATAAVTMHRSLEAAREALAVVAPGFAGVTVRWAVHYGEVIAGNLGSHSRMEYTVIGDAVNTAARLEEITPARAAWFTGEAVRAVPGGLAEAEYLHSTTLRGRATATEVWGLQLDAPLAGEGDRDTSALVGHAADLVLDSLGPGR